MKKATVFLADGFELVEGLTVVDLLRRADIDVTTVSIKNDVMVNSANKVTVKADATLAESDWSGADLIVFPGGMPGTTNLSECEDVRRAIKTFAEAGKPVGAICAAPAILLGQTGYLAGKKGTCYPGMEKLWISGEHSEDAVVVDLPFITSRGVGTAIPFALSLIAELLGKEKADAIAKEIVYL